MMVDLCQNAIIFKITDKTNNECYISYTLTSIDDKMQQLKYYYTNHLTNNRPFTLKNIFENNDYETEIIEILKNASEIQILSRLREVIQSTQCINRKKFVGLTNEIGHKNAKQIYSKHYRDRHKNEIKLCKAKIVVCECGIEVSNAHFARHRKTNKHIKNLKS